MKNSFQPPETVETPDGPMTRREVSAYYGIPLGTVIRNLWQGHSVAHMLEVRAKAKKAREGRKRFSGRTFGKFPTPWGMKNLHGIAAKLGMSWHTLRNRIYRDGMPTELAFNTPPFGKVGVDFIMPPEEFRRRTAEVWARRYALWLENRRTRDLVNRSKAKALASTRGQSLCRIAQFEGNQGER